MAGGARPFWWSNTALLVYLALAKVVLHFATNGNYGFFRDELYYIACSDHLAWGYVDHPPLSIGVLAATRALLGDSIFAIRLPVVLVGALCVVLSGLLARALGGGRSAQWLAALAYLIMGSTLAMSSFFSMNAFDLFFWLACMLIAAQLLRRGDTRWWLALGAVAGFGILNKYSVGFCLFGLVAGMLLTSSRRYLFSGWTIAGGAVAAVICLPHALWQVAYGFPTAEFIRNATLYKIVPLPPAAFLGAQVIQSNPFTAPFWLAGLAYLLFAPSMRRFRALGLMYLVVLAVFVFQQVKPYYLAPAYPVLMAAGGLAVERVARRRSWRWLPAACAIWLGLGGVLVAPLAVPVLAPATYVRYAELVGIQAPREERSAAAELPQILADRFGWQNMVATIARVYDSLPSRDRARAAVLTGNYGEAAAVDFFGGRYGLPKAISGHNSYWLWGPGNAGGDVVISVGTPKAELEKEFASVEQAATIVSPYAMPLETNLPVYVCRGLEAPMGEAWRRIKRFM